MCRVGEPQAGVPVLYLQWGSRSWNLCWPHSFLLPYNTALSWLQWEEWDIGNFAKSNIACDVALGDTPIPILQCDFLDIDEIFCTVLLVIRNSIWDLYTSFSVSVLD